MLTRLSFYLTPNLPFHRKKVRFGRTWRTLTYDERLRWTTPLSQSIYLLMVQESQSFDPSQNKVLCYFCTKTPETNKKYPWSPKSESVIKLCYIILLIIYAVLVQKCIRGVALIHHFYIRQKHSRERSSIIQLKSYLKGLCIILKQLAKNALN